MIAQELEVSLHMAFVEARQKRHEFITVEHLLLALLDNPSAAEALRACGAKVEALRRDLTNFIAEHTPSVSGEDEIDTQPNWWSGQRNLISLHWVSAIARTSAPMAGRARSTRRRSISSTSD